MMQSVDKYWTVSDILLKIMICMGKSCRPPFPNQIRHKVIYGNLSGMLYGIIL